MEQTLDRTDSYVIPEARIAAAWWGVVVLFLVHGLVVSTWVSRIVAIKAGLRTKRWSFRYCIICGCRRFGPGDSGNRMDSNQVREHEVGAIYLVWLLPVIDPSRISTNFAMLFMALFVHGAMAGANDVAMNSHAVGIEKLFGKPTMSRFHAMFSLGGIAGAGMGALVASQGIAPTMHFAVAVVLILGLIVAAAPVMLDTHERHEKRARMQFTRPPRALIVLSAIGFCIFLSEGAIADWTAVYIRAGFARRRRRSRARLRGVFRHDDDLPFLWRCNYGETGPSVDDSCRWPIAACGLAMVVIAATPIWALAGFAAAGVGFSSSSRWFSQPEDACLR